MKGILQYGAQRPTQISNQGNLSVRQDGNI